MLILQKNNEVAKGCQLGEWMMSMNELTTMSEWLTDMTYADSIDSVLTKQTCLSRQFALQWQSRTYGFGNLEFNWWLTVGVKNDWGEWMMTMNELTGMSEWLTDMMYVDGIDGVLTIQTLRQFALWQQSRTYGFGNLELNLWLKVLGMTGVNEWQAWMNWLVWVNDWLIWHMQMALTVCWQIKHACSRQFALRQQSTYGFGHLEFNLCLMALRMTSMTEWLTDMTYADAGEGVLTNQPFQSTFFGGCEKLRTHFDFFPLW